MNTPVQKLYKLIDPSDEKPMVVEGQFCQSELDKYLSEGWKEFDQKEVDQIKKQAVKEAAPKPKETIKPLIKNKAKEA